MTALTFRKFLLILAFIQALSFSQGSVMAMDEGECAAEMRVIANSVDSKFSENGDLSMVPTVEISAPVPGRHGGHRYKVTCTRDTWFSVHSSLPNAPQGDPRWFFSTGGEEVAHFFGFELHDARTVMVPDALEFTNAVEEVNRVLSPHDQIAVRFYSTNPANSQVPAREYLDKFVQQGELPVGGGNVMIHDLSFHTSAIFFPADMIERAQKLAQAGVEFVDHFQTIAKGSLPDEVISRMTETILRTEANRIDVASGSLGRVFNGKSESFNEVYEAAFKKIVSAGKSPQEHVISLYLTALRQLEIDGTVITQKQRNIALRFLVDFHMQQLDAGYTRAYSTTLEDFCARVRAKRKAIVDAVGQLSKDGAPSR